MPPNEVVQRQFRGLRDGLGRLHEASCPVDVGALVRRVGPYPQVSWQQCRAPHCFKSDAGSKLLGMASQQRPVVFFGTFLATLVCGCTNFVGADEGSGGLASGVTSSGEGSTADAGTPDPTAASASGASMSATAAPTSPTTDDSASGPDTTTSSETSMSEAESDPDTSDSTTSSSTTAGTSSSSSSTGEPEDLLGMPCQNDGECATDDDQICCTDNDCLGTCAVPCSVVEECPEEGMGCVHDHCFFECNGDDADCDAWPTYTCEHGGSYCEVG